jgi:hypothetical protein
MSVTANLLHSWHGQQRFCCLFIYICLLGSGSASDMWKSSYFNVYKMGLFGIVGESVRNCVYSVRKMSLHICFMMISVARFLSSLCSWMLLLTPSCLWNKWISPQIQSFLGHKNDTLFGFLTSHCYNCVWMWLFICLLLGLLMNLKTSSCGALVCPSSHFAFHLIYANSIPTSFILGYLLKATGWAKHL